jgi:hypothetical protein
MGLKRITLLPVSKEKEKKKKEKRKKGKIGFRP